MPLLGSLIRRAYELRQIPLSLPRPNPAAAQRRVLISLLRKAQDTAFGTSYDFRSVLAGKNPEALFRSRVPVHDYSSMFSRWWYRSLNGEPWVTWPGQVRYFALTSGTSEASSKHIPVTGEMLRAIRQASIRQLVSTTRYGFPDSFYEKGILMLGGSTHLQYNGTFYQGDLSGITASNLPFWFQHFYKPGRRISREQEWAVKLTEIIRNAPQWDIGIMVGVPAWIQILLERIIEHHKLANIHELWPNLAAYVHSGVSFTPYLKSFEPLLGKPLLYNESYLASEGFVAFQQPGSDGGMELILDNGIYFEFIPFTSDNFDNEGQLRPGHTVLNIQEVSAGEEYALLLTTCAGAWRYLIGDTIRFTSTEKCEVMLTGRIKHFLSLAGEHLSQDNMNRAIGLLQEETGAQISEFAVAGVRHGSLFAHQWYLGTNDRINAGYAAARLDSYLQMLNDDYRVERSSAIKEVSVKIIPLHLFHDWMKARGKEGGAHKFPRVLKNGQHEQWEEHLRSWNEINE